MSDSEAVIRSQRRKKQKAVEYFGGKCQICGYEKCLSALEFHHEDDKSKKYSPSYVILRWSWDRALEELRKCVLVCSNCHREIHYGMHEVEEIRKLILPSLKRCCPVCENEYETKIEKQQFCSQKCYKISSRKVKRPTKIELQQLINNMSWRGIGKKFNVSDNAVRKWAKNYNLI